MKWKKFMAVFLAAGLFFSANAAVAHIAYAQENVVLQPNTEDTSVSDIAEETDEAGMEDVSEGESAGKESEDPAAGQGDDPADDEGTSVTEDGILPADPDTGAEETDPADGSAQTGTAEDAEDIDAEKETDDMTSDELSDQENSETAASSDEKNDTKSQGSSDKKDERSAGADASSSLPKLPAAVLPGNQTVGAMKDSMNPNAGLMEQTEAAQRIITGSQDSGYATRARQEKRSASGTGSSHYVRPGSYSVDAYAPQVGTIVASPVIKKEFRFWTVAKESAIAKKKLPIREEMKSNSRTIGILPEDGVCYILKEEDGGWIYVESGTVRGFVRKELLISGLKATMLVETREIAATILGNMSDQTFSEEEILGVAEEKVPAEENAALTFRRATVYQTVVDKDPALAAWDVSIREEQSEEAREIGTLKKGGICYVITDRDQDWVYVESGDVRGFVKKEDLLFSDTKINEEGKTLKDQIEERGESTYSLASELISAEENKALYYSLMSIRSGVPGSSKREAVLSYAAQFIGNPYVWGGTDPVHGADCSGFVQTVYKQFGYTLPRVAAQQALSSEKIPVSEALPGDLIFYGNASGIYHVVIYAGGDQTIEAKGRKYGIVSSTLNQKAAVWAIRVMDDADALEYDIPEGLGTVHSYMGWQKVTNTRSQQYAFRKAAGMTFDQEGFAVVDNRYVIACTDTFGAIGDYVDFYQEDGTKIPCIIGDFKNEHDAGCNKWGHMNGQCIVEFVVDQTSWYPTHHANPGTASCHPEWHQDIVKAEKVGSFYE